MITHWSQQWLAIEREGKFVVFLGEGAPGFELHIVQESDNHTVQPLSPRI
jgi:hypothetical protein